MEYSKNFTKVKNYFILGLWDDTRVRNAVIKEWITEDEYLEITGETY